MISGGHRGTAVATDGNGMRCFFGVLIVSLWQFATLAWSQVPAVTPGGIVSAASYTPWVVPGSIVSVFGSNLAAGPTSAGGPPLPTTLNGTSVSINGANAHLYFVSPGQINFEMPSTPLFDYTSDAMLRVTTAAGTSAAAVIPLLGAIPAVFSTNGTGCGQAAAVGVSASGDVSINSQASSAAPGDYIELYGTGMGEPFFPPPDGTAATSPESVDTRTDVVIGGKGVPSSYDGLAPTLVGVDQVNFQIPADTRNGCAVPVSVGSSLVSISVNAARGPCVDPPAESYGSIELTRTIATGTTSDGETDTFTAIFPSGPGIHPAPPESIPPAGSYTNGLAMAQETCPPLFGDSLLSAGSIQIQSSTGAPVTVAPQSVPGGSKYGQNFSSGFIASGNYSISAPGGAVSFNTSLPVGSPIQITTPLTPGTVITPMKPFTLQWTGGDAGATVRVSISETIQNTTYSLYGYADASAGSFTFAFPCQQSGDPLGSSLCTIGIPLSSNAQIIVAVLPAQPFSFAAEGVTQSVQAKWIYRYVFGGISLT